MGKGKNNSLLRTVKISYNPYLFKTFIEINGFNVDDFKQLEKYKNGAFDYIVEDIVADLFDIINDDFIVNFHGRNSEYLDLFEQINKYNSLNNRGILIEHEYSLDDSNSIDDLKQLFKEIQNGPFEDLKTTNIVEAFKSATEKNDFEIGVVATMKAGKSTFLNSLLGEKLLPSKTEACTAKIFKIKDINDRVGFSAKELDASGNLVNEIYNVSFDELSKMNENKDSSLILLEGDIPGINSKYKNLILFDTPGPNNARDASHKAKTHDFINNESNGLVLFVRNTGNLSTNDDQELISFIADAMHKKGKKSKERFIFILNKVDEIDNKANKDENLGTVIANCKKDIEKFGIINPSIFPVSSYAALLSRIKSNRFSMTEKEEADFIAKSFYFKKGFGQQIIDETPIVKSIKSAIQKKYDEAKLNHHEENTLLYSSGIPFIEEYVNAFLEKYSKPLLIRDALNTFQKDVINKNVMSKVINDIKDTKGKADSLIKEINIIIKNIESGEKATEIKNDIKKLDFDHSAEESLNKIKVEFEEEIDSLNTILNIQGELTPKEATKTIEDFKNKFNRILHKLQKRNYEFLEIHIYNKAKELYNYYVQYAKSLIESDIKLDIGNADLQKLLGLQIKSASEFNDSIRFYDKPEIKIKRHERSNWNPKKWLSFLDEDLKYYYEEYTVTKKLADISEVKRLAQKVAQPIRVSIGKMKEFADSEINRIKKDFLSEIKTLEKNLLEQTNTLKNILQNKKQLEQTIIEFEKNREWLTNIMNKMDKFIEVY